MFRKLEGNREASCSSKLGLKLCMQRTDVFSRLGPEPSACRGGLGESWYLPSRETHQLGTKVGLASRAPEPREGLACSKGPLPGAAGQRAQAAAGLCRAGLTDASRSTPPCAIVHGGCSEWMAPSLTAGDTGGPGRGRPRVERSTPRNAVPEASTLLPRLHSPPGRRFQFRKGTGEGWTDG